MKTFVYVLPFYFLWHALSNLWPFLSPCKAALCLNGNRMWKWWQRDFWNKHNSKKTKANELSLKSSTLSNPYTSMKRTSFGIVRGFYTKKGDKLRNIPALPWGEKEPCQSMVGTHRHSVHFAQVAMEPPQAKPCLWEVLSLPPRNSCWIDKFEWRLSVGRRSSNIRNTKLFPGISPKLYLPYTHQGRQKQNLFQFS